MVGCSVISEGCTNCYAMALAARLEGMGNRYYDGTTKEVHGKTYWTGVIRRNSVSAFNKPRTIKPPSIFFVNSMSDFFHDNVTDADRMDALLVMAECNRHQFQILTKRPENIRPFFQRTKAPILKNVWLGATVEDNRVSDRIDILRGVPAAIRFLSVEPLIAPLGRADFRGIDWVITGGESGPGARPMRVEWMREVRDLCLEYGTPHFFKQWGIPRNNPIGLSAPAGVSHDTWVYRNDPIGKGGSLLDGRHWKELPRDFTVAAYDEKLLEEKA